MGLLVNHRITHAHTHTHTQTHTHAHTHTHTHKNKHTQIQTYTYTHTHTHTHTHTNKHTNTPTYTYTHTCGTPVNTVKNNTHSWPPKPATHMYMHTMCMYVHCTLSILQTDIERNKEDRQLTYRLQEHVCPVQPVLVWIAAVGRGSG